uniref:trafficking kinesin-binding protein 1-like isoform X2 n=1 Tax=Ciona intestinalis TaxID=7719 RepID=UPI000521AE6F|nr:trafficking kinesin-binding protein 1-like isoform X2 [Ciona intestinalis]|eukprot:XP_009860655.1 trafficking kinesin-binding protein 1-like isoform X2 [Ciona intestinalis]
MQEASTLTDLHNNPGNNENRLISEISNKIPKYKLRADSVNGYANADWLECPVLPPDVDVDLSYEQCKEIFKLFLLSSERVSKMTKTYHDIDAVFSLLEEKEKDLELAARIGQALLLRNKNAVQEKEILEERLAIAVEEASQLKHEISMKQDLLHAYADNESDTSSTASPIKEYKLFGRTHLQLDVDTLHDRIKELECDNAELQLEKSAMHDHSANQGEVVTDTVKQLGILQEDLKSANEQICIMTEQLSARTEDMTRQEIRITQLLSQISQLQDKHKQLSSEHEELQHHLYSANKSQAELTQEVHALEERYQEVCHLLDQTNEESRLRETSLCSEDLDFTSGIHIPFRNSLAAELESSGVCLDGNSMFHVSGMENKRQSHNTLDDQKKVFETARIANNIGNHHSPTHKSKPLSLNYSTSPTPLNLHLQKEGFVPSTPSSGLTTPNMGKPGIPGTDDLERAIRKLTVRHDANNSVLSTSSELFSDIDFDHLLPSDVRTSSSCDFMRKCQSAPRLRIVKPLEGSSTLHQWKSLAERNTHPLNLDEDCITQGVMMRGARPKSCSFNSSTSDHPSGRNIQQKSEVETTDYLPGAIPKKSILKAGSAPSSSNKFLKNFGSRKSSPLSIPIKKSKDPSNLRYLGLESHDGGPNLGESPMFRTVKSSPHLVGLAAALLPPAGLRRTTLGFSGSFASTGLEPSTIGFRTQPGQTNIGTDWADLHGTNLK